MRDQGLAVLAYHPQHANGKMSRAGRPWPETAGDSGPSLSRSILPKGRPVGYPGPAHYPCKVAVCGADISNKETRSLPRRPPLDRDMDRAAAGGTLSSHAGQASAPRPALHTGFPSVSTHFCGPKGETLLLSCHFSPPPADSAARFVPSPRPRIRLRTQERCLKCPQGSDFTA